MVELARVYLGNSQNFKTQYEIHFTALKFFAMRYVGDEEVACDLIQDMFVKLWERKESFENDQVLKTYLYRAVRNNCLTYIRNKRRMEKRLEGHQEEDTEESFVTKVMEAEVYALINEIFEELPDACKKVYSRSLEGKSHQEISEELHIAINTIKRHKNNANHYLRERLEKILSLVLSLS